MKLVPVSSGIRVKAPQVIDSRSTKIVGKESRAYDSAAEALAAIPRDYQCEGLVVFIRNGDILEWWQFKYVGTELSLSPLDIGGGVISPAVYNLQAVTGAGNTTTHPLTILDGFSQQAVDLRFTSQGGQIGVFKPGFPDDAVQIFASGSQVMLRDLFFGNTNGYNLHLKSKGAGEEKTVYLPNDNGTLAIKFQVGTEVFQPDNNGFVNFGDVGGIDKSIYSHDGTIAEDIRTINLNSKKLTFDFKGDGTNTFNLLHQGGNATLQSFLNDGTYQSYIIQYGNGVTMSQSSSSTSNSFIQNVSGTTINSGDGTNVGQITLNRNGNVDLNVKELSFTNLPMASAPKVLLYDNATARVTYGTAPASPFQATLDAGPNLDKITTIDTGGGTLKFSDTYNVNNGPLEIFIKPTTTTWSKPAIRIDAQNNASGLDVQVSNNSGVYIRQGYGDGYAPALNISGSNSSSIKVSGGKYGLDIANTTDYAIVTNGRLRHMHHADNLLASYEIYPTSDATIKPIVKFYNSNSTEGSGISIGMGTGFIQYNLVVKYTAYSNKSEFYIENTNPMNKPWGLKSTGQMMLPLYGTVTPFTGTAAKWLAVTSTGDVIEMDPPSGGGTAYNFKNGISPIGGSDVGLGGSLTQATTITGGTNVLTITSAVTDGVVISNLASGKALKVMTTGSANVLNLVGGTSACVSSTSTYAGLSHTATPPSGNSTFLIMDLRAVPSVTAAAGLGSFIQFAGSIAAGPTYPMNRLQSKWLNATNSATKLAEFSINGTNGGLEQDVFAISGTGATKFHKYGAGTFSSGTATRWLAVTSAGDMIEMTTPVVNAYEGLTAASGLVKLGGTHTDITLDGGNSFNFKMIKQGYFLIHSSTEFADGASFKMGGSSNNNWTTDIRQQNGSRDIHINMRALDVNNHFMDLYASDGTNTKILQITPKAIWMNGLPVYANEAAAEADATLNTNSLFRVTGSHTLYIK